MSLSESIPTTALYRTGVNTPKCYRHCEWRTCPRFLRGGYSGIRTCDPPDGTPNSPIWGLPGLVGLRFCGGQVSSGEVIGKTETRRLPAGWLPDSWVLGWSGRSQAVCLIDVRNVFYVFFIIFIKNAFFNVFYFGNVFYFLVGIF